MKINIFTLGLVGMLITSPVYAEEYILGQTDYVGMDNYLGAVCSTNGKILIKCNCLSPGLDRRVTASCDAIDSMPYDGCKLLSYAGGTDNYYCVDAAGENVDICMMCQCNNDQSWSSWTTIGSNRASRSVYTKSYTGYVCTSTSSTQYGCAANYYTTATSPSASMTCSACPSSGKSSVGNTAITGCYIPANTALTDTSGSYKYTSDCHYSK